MPVLKEMLDYRKQFFFCKDFTQLQLILSFQNLVTFYHFFTTIIVGVSLLLDTLFYSVLLGQGSILNTVLCSPFCQVLNAMQSIQKEHKHVHLTKYEQNMCTSKSTGCFYQSAGSLPSKAAWMKSFCGNYTWISQVQPPLCKRLFSVSKLKLKNEVGNNKVV